MQILHHLFKVAPVLLPPLLLSGCAAVVVGTAVGTAAYLNGDLEGYLPATIEQTAGAAEAAAKDLKLVPVSKTSTADKSLAHMVAVDSAGRKITFRLTPENPKITKVSIRVGAGGNEAYSRRILMQIEKRLPGS